MTRYRQSNGFDKKGDEKFRDMFSMEIFMSPSHSGHFHLGEFPFALFLSIVLLNNFREIENYRP